MVVSQRGHSCWLMLFGGWLPRFFQLCVFCSLLFLLENKNSKHPYDLKKYIGRIWKNSPHLLFSLLMTRVIPWKATPFGNKPYKTSKKRNLLGYIANFYFTNYNPWFLMVKQNNFLLKTHRRNTLGQKLYRHADRRLVLYTAVTLVACLYQNNRACH